jgi:hypothetical protein
MRPIAAWSEETMKLQSVVLCAALLGGCSLVKSEPQRSYCEAVCDWAVGCVSVEREVDLEAMRASCVSAAEAVDPACADASAGALDPLTSEALSACTEAIDASASAGECDGFTGSIDDIKTATTAPECASEGAAAQEVITAAQSSTAETNEELCTRFSESFCLKAESCILGDYAGEIPQEAIDAAGGTPYDLCVAGVSAITNECVSSDRYAPEESLDDVNLARQAARECLIGFDALTCDEIFSGEMPELCAGSFSSTEDAAAFAAALYQIGQAYAN